MLQFLIPMVLAAAVSSSDSVVVRVKEVVVTGVRTPESLMSIPAAVSVRDAGAFQNTRAFSLKDALDGLPGVLVQSRGGAQDVRVTIRGYGARGSGERSNHGSMRGIRVLTDGIPVTEPDGRTALDLVDIGAADRVEVSRSNASVLYGNASGGVINLRTNMEFPRSFLEVSGRGGAFGYMRQEVRGGFTAGDSRFSTSVSNADYDGWRAHSGSHVSQVHARVNAPVLEQTRLGVLMDFSTGIYRFPGALTRAQLDSAPEQANPAFVTRDERRDNNVYRAAMTLDHRIGAEHELSASAWVEPKSLHRSERKRYRDFQRHHVGGSASWLWKEQLGEEAQSRLTLGGDEAWQDGSILFYNLTPTGGRSTVVFANKREAANSAGLSLQEEIRLPQWSFRGAVRYDNLRYISNDFIQPSLDAVKTFERWTPKASVAYLAGDHTVYASLGGGVESPAFNEIDPPAPFDTATSLNPFLKPVHSTTVELGAKGVFAYGEQGANLGYDVALYNIVVRDDIVPFDGGAYFQTAGRTRRRGVEAGLNWLPVGHLSLDGSATLSNNEYQDYSNDLGNFAGNKVAGLPSFNGRLKARYELVAGLGLEGTVDAVGKYFADDKNSAEAPSYASFGAAADYRRELGNGNAVSLWAGVQNISDKKYVGSAYINGIGGQFFEPGLPRNVTAGFRYHY